MNPFCQPAEHLSRGPSSRARWPPPAAALLLANFGGLFDSQTIAAEVSKKASTASCCG